MVHRVESENQGVRSATSRGINAGVDGVGNVRKLWKPYTTLIVQLGPQNGQNSLIGTLCLAI